MKKNNTANIGIVNLFDYSEIEDICIFLINQNRYKETGNDELDAYHNGIADGVERIFYLLLRAGE